MSNQTNRNSNHKIKLFRLALCAIVVIISIGTSLVVYTLAQSSNNNNMSSKLNPASNPDRQITLVAEDVIQYTSMEITMIQLMVYYHK
ncbi:MAG: hypothetical protein K0R16_1105 [Nitrososphaeraceae archaeon]|nr:hypothetical protein [Nitrososphaeraceae archaeon]